MLNRRWERRVVAVGVVSCLVVGLAPGLVRAAATFQGLGHLPGAAGESVARGVSADGSVVVGYSGYLPGQPRAFRWTAAGGLQDLGRFPGTGASTRALAVSGDGSTIVGYGGDGTDMNARAFRWTADDRMVPLAPADAGYDSTAAAVSGNGSVVVGLRFFPAEAFRWTLTGGVQGLGVLGPLPSGSRAGAVSADGTIVAGSTVVVGEQSPHLFRWTPQGGMVRLSELPGTTFSEARGMSADGSVIVGTANVRGRSGGEAIRWTDAGGMELLRDDLATGPGKEAAWDVTADGRVIVGTTDYGAFVWDDKNGMRNLQSVLADEYGLGAPLSGWELLSANGISDDGRTIVGYATNPSGDGEAFVVVLPEPSTSAWLAVGAAAWLRRRRRLRDG